MGREGFEYLLGFHAAPMFRGLKGGSLLSFRKSRFRDFDRLLASYEPCFRCKGISVFRVAEGEEYVLLLFYRRHVLERNLKRGLARKILKQCGYRDEDTLDQMLARLQARMRLQKTFPHEVGLFLDYPPEDVEGFITHRGRKFCCSGYWKVYANEAQTRKLFERYTDCTQKFCQQLERGASFQELILAV